MKKRILVVAPYNNGTIAMCSRNLYLALKEKADFEVKCVVVHRFRKDTLSEFDECEFCVEKEAHPLMKWVNLIKQVSWLKKIKKEFNPDVTISTLGGCSTINVLAGGSDKKVGIFHAPHLQAKAKGKIVYWNTLFNFRYIYPRLDKLACVSSEVKRSIIESFPLFLRKDVRIVYNVHNIADIITKAQEELKSDEQKIIDKHTILYIGRFDRNKAPDRALKAFLQAVPKLPKDAKLCFIGKDSCNIQPELEQFVNDNNLADRVFFLGFQSNPYKFLSKAMCLISTSYSEGLPGVMIESLLLGKPVITTNSSEGVWEIMSCHDDYEKNLLSIHKCEDGIITQNRALEDKNCYDNDIKHLSYALEQVFQVKYNVGFSFYSQIKKENIINQLLENCF